MTASASISISSIYGTSDKPKYAEHADLNQRVHPSLSEGSKTQFSKGCESRFSSAVKNEETRRIWEREGPQTEKDPRDELQAQGYSPGRTPWNYSQRSLIRRPSSY